MWFIPCGAFHHSCFTTGVWRCLRQGVVIKETRHFPFLHEGAAEDNRAERINIMKNLVLLSVGILSAWTALAKAAYCVINHSEFGETRNYHHVSYWALMSGSMG